jgi:hypothetical protein
VLSYITAWNKSQTKKDESIFRSMPERVHKCHLEVANIIAQNYDKLKTRCWHPDTVEYGGLNYDDIFQDTVMYVIGDDKAAACKSDEELLDWFCYRYNMIQFRTIQDYRQSRIVYADYQQTEKEKED